MTKSIAALTALAGLSLAATTPAHAVTWDWTLTGFSTGSGTLTTSSVACSGGCAVETFLGTYNGHSITGLDTTYNGGGGLGTSSPPDNLLYYPGSSPSQVDTTGIYAGGSANVSYPGFGSADGTVDTSGAHNSPESFSASPVPTTPLPATLPLFASGLGGSARLAQEAEALAVA